MSLLKLLKEEKIQVTKGFELEIMTEEYLLERNWALLLLNDNTNILEDVAEILENTVNLTKKKARLIALYTHLAGSSVIAKGSLSYINGLSEKLGDMGMNTEVINLYKRYMEGGNKL